MTRVLFLSSGVEDYLSDAVLHGLRLVLGGDCVDVPRRDALYAGHPDRGSLYGRGFTLWGRLPDVDVDRANARPEDFDVVVIGDVWRAWEPWLELAPRVGTLGATVVLLDGGDGPVVFPHGPTWWRTARPRPIPRAAGRVALFKRELQPLSYRVAGFGSQALGRRRLRGVRPIAFAIPEDVLATGDEPKTQEWPAQVIDAEVAAAVGADPGNRGFDVEAAYHADLRASRFAPTTRKAGWETLRHYEIAAAGCVPCFRDLDDKPVECAPFGLVDGVNCLAYRSAAELVARTAQLTPERYAQLRAGALAWARANTTRARASELLTAIGAAA